MNPYEVLGVTRDANEKTIKRAYRKLARECHPDSCQDPDEKEKATAKLKLINAAAEILLSPEKRSAYDVNHTNVYEYYANKQSTSKKGKRKSQTSKDIENETKTKQKSVEELYDEFIQNVSQIFIIILII